MAHLVEAADDICYALLDLEDAVELRLLSFDDVADSLLGHIPPDEQNRVRSQFAIGLSPKGEPSPALSFRVNLARLRGAVFQFAIDGAFESFVNNYGNIMEGRLQEGLITSLPPDDSRRRLIESAKNLSSTHVFPDTKKVELELGAYSTFDTLLSSFCEAALDQAHCIKAGRGIGWKSALVMQLLGDHAPSKENANLVGAWTPYQCLRRVLDFITGMTDNYATYVARQLQGGGFSGGQRP